ncbi:MAG: FecR domain-containing protein [Bacteroidota bacterium]
MKTFSLGLLLITVTLLVPVIAAEPPTGSVALVSKVILDVSRKESDKTWQTAKRGETLSTGDKVKTGEKSLAVIKFKDNSLVRVRERSELTVTGEVNRGAFSKSVNMEKGVVGFNIKKQQTDEEFRFTSPTSVASIRGTGGQFTSSAAADTLTVIEGLVRLTNKLSSEFVDVGAGFTGISNPNGSVEARPATPEEQQAALEASKISDQENRLEFEFRDGQGNRKMLKIEYK